MKEMPSCSGDHFISVIYGVRLKGVSVSDGRWEIYGPQKERFEPVAEVAAESHFRIDTARPLTDQLSSVIESL